MKVLILQWIVMNCDSKRFTGMKWENKAKGIFSLYWKHQSSRSCRENTAESAALYEYYREWARHKNRQDGRKQPRDLKAAFRNALEKKDELERLSSKDERLACMDTKDKIFWRFKNFPGDQNETCASSQTPSKKPKGPPSRGRKPSSNLIQSSTEFPINFGASTSTVEQDGIPGRKKPRKIYQKGTRKASAKDKKSFAVEEVVSSSYDPIVNGFPVEQENTKNRSPLPSFDYFKRNDPNNGSWEDSLENAETNFSSQSPRFSETPYDKPNSEDVWTPQFVSQVTPPRLASDLMEVSSTEFMDLLIPNQKVTYSFQPTPPQEANDILFDDITDADLVTLRKIINGGEPTILKYSFPLQPKDFPTSYSPLTNAPTQQPPATSSHYCPSDYASMMKISNVQNNNCHLDSTTTVNTFQFDQKQCSFDQVVPPLCEAFQTSQQTNNKNTSELFANDWSYENHQSLTLYSSPFITINGQKPEEICHQQEDTGELFRYTDQTSHDDTGISDMEGFLDSAHKFLDNIDFQYNEPNLQMC